MLLEVTALLGEAGSDPLPCVNYKFQDRKTDACVLL